MLLKLFSDNKVITAVLTILFSGILWLPGFFSSPDISVAQVEPMPLYALIFGGLNMNINFSRFLAWSFLLFQAYLLVLLSSKYLLIESRSFLPALFFLLIVSFYSGLKQFSAAIFGGLFMIASINSFFDTLDKDDFTYRFFDAGLLLGIGSLFYAKLIFFLPVIWIAAIILRKFNWRELVMAVLGLALPYIFVVAIDFIRDEEALKIFLTLSENLHIAEIPLQASFGFWFIAAMLFFITLLSSIYMLKIFQFRKVFMRNFYLIFFWLFLISLLVFAFFSSGDMGIVYILSIPLAFIFSNYFHNVRKTKGNKLLFVLILAAFLFNGLNELFTWL